MEYNPSKRQVIHVTKSKHNIPTHYYQHGVKLEWVCLPKCFGIVLQMTSGGVLTLIDQKGNQTKFMSTFSSPWYSLLQCHAALTMPH